MNKGIKRGKSCYEEGSFLSKNKIERFTGWLATNIRNIYQRAKYGFCESDIYEMDRWFLMVIPAMLEHLKKRHLDFPLTVYKYLPDIKPEDDESGELAFNKWNEILSEMIRTFDRLNAFKDKIEGKSVTHPFWVTEKEEKYRDKLKDKAFKMFSEWFFELWW